jgi:hypothetical protein
VLAAFGFRVEPADAKRQCAFWGTGGALRRFRKCLRHLAASTPFAHYDCSLLNTDWRPRLPNGRSRNTLHAALNVSHARLVILNS